MTDRYSGFVVALDDDVRSDDAEMTIAAIRQIKGVLGVEPIIYNPEIMLAQMRVRSELMEKLYEVLTAKPTSGK